MSKPIVVIESPFGGDVVRNIAYARACLADAISRDEAPVASHLLYTQPGVLDDKVPGERRVGMETGWEFMRVAARVVVYTDLGISSGMNAGINHAKHLGVPVVYRTIPFDKSNFYVTFPSQREIEEDGLQ